MTCLCESRLRENCTSGLSGGRGPALRRAPSDPTVGDVNDVHMAKGCRMVCVWTIEVFFNLEASK